MQRGFTLLELLIVITILSILAGAIMPLFQTSSLQAKLAKAKTDLDIIRSAALRLKIDTGTIVHQNRGNGTNLNDPYCLADNAFYSPDPAYDCSNLTNWEGPYLTWVNDPWGNPYKICGAAQERLAHSNGPNGTDDGCYLDDVCKDIFHRIPGY